VYQGLMKDLQGEEEWLTAVEQDLCKHQPISDNENELKNQYEENKVKALYFKIVQILVQRIKTI
jgi:hypothetical protein